MADLIVQGDELVLELDTVERLEGIHGNVAVPVDAVQSIDVIEDALSAVHGIRTGTGIPGVLVVGTIRWAGKKSFVVIHHKQHRAVSISLQGAEYDELVVGCDDPEGMVARIQHARPGLAGSR